MIKIALSVLELLLRSDPGILLILERKILDHQVNTQNHFGGHHKVETSQLFISKLQC